MEKRTKSADKENINTKVSLSLSKVKNKSIPAKKSKNAGLLGACEVEQSREQKQQTERVVDQIKRPLPMRTRKPSSHIGEQALIPITLEALRRTLSKRITVSVRQ